MIPLRPVLLAVSPLVAVPPAAADEPYPTRPVSIVVNAELPWKSAKELFDDARKRPGEITYTSSGIYGASHVPIEMLLHAAGGIRMRHLPTTGGAPATTAVPGKHAALWASPPALAIPHIKAGKSRVDSK